MITDRSIYFGGGSGFEENGEAESQVISVFYGSVYHCFHFGMLLFLLVDGVVFRIMVKRKFK